MGAGRLGQVVVQAEALERGALVAGGGVQEQADGQPVPGPDPGGQATP